MTLASVLFPERDCATCKNQIEWGCDNPPQIPILFPSGDELGEMEQLDRCPRRPYLDNPRFYQAVLAIWAYAQKGILPEPGGWCDMGAKVPPLLTVIDAAINEGNEEKEKREKSRQDRLQRADRQHAKSGGGRRARPHVRR